MDIIFPTEAHGIKFTGERYIPGVTGQLQFEHLHRYVLATMFAEGKNVLDIACGEGYGANALSQVARTTVGMDNAKEIIERAGAIYKRPGLTFKSGDLEAIPLPDKTIDLITCFETIEHVAKQEAAIQEIKRVLRTDGLVLISTPNAKSTDGAWHDENPFHVHEMDRNEFECVLKKHFKNVFLLEQSFFFGSFIASIDELKSACTTFEMKESGEICQQAGTIGDSYFIAFASDEVIPPVNITAFNARYQFDKIVQDFKYSIDKMHEQENWIAEISAKNAEYEQRIIEKTKQCHVLETELDRLRSELDLTKRRGELARIQTEHMRRKLASSDTSQK